MNELLHEYCDSRGVSLRIDRQSGVLRGVKILGLTSRNGRRYRNEALVEAVKLYEGAKVNVNHPKAGPLSPRDYQDRIGAIHNVSLREGQGLFGDFHFNPRHSLADQLVWDAEHAAENVGFSHNVTARTVREGNQVVVESIVEVHSVDLVADPATTRGLFETRPDTSLNELETETAPAWSKLTTAQLREHRPDLVEALLVEQQNELTRLRAELDQLRIVQSTQQRRAQALKLLREYDLPGPDSADPNAQVIAGQPFVDQLVAAESEADMQRLVEQRAQLVHSARRLNPDPLCGQPTSRDQHEVMVEEHDVESIAEFARSIT